MIEAIQKYCAKITTEFELISPERQQLLRKIADYIRRKKSEGSTVNLIYICTHNSRRSHFGQIWAHVAADYYGIDKVYTYSGGTEATAFNPNTINALRRIGFDVRIMKDGNNPVYHIIHDESSSPSVCFSKVYDDVANPQSSFAAIMTCSDAEENCPFIPGVELRIGTTYEDPKAFDNTPLQDLKYDERCRQIARETLYAFSLL